MKKKIVIVLLILAVLLIPATMILSAQYEKGDINGDGQINAIDALQALRSSVKEITLSEDAATAGDVDGNGVVNAVDALQILRFSVNEIQDFNGPPPVIPEEPEEPQIVTKTVIRKGDLGVDVSAWQNWDINWKTAMNSGIKFAVLRAGWEYTADTHFEHYYTTAKNAGLPVGVYWYSYAESVADAEKEAAACLKVLNGRQIDLPVFFDIEDNSLRKYGKTQLTAESVAFCKKIEAAGYDAMIYSSESFLFDYIDYNSAQPYGFWVAEWYNNLSTLRPPHTSADFYVNGVWRDHLLWQYFNRGSVPGICTTDNPNVDLDYAVMDYTVTVPVSSQKKAPLRMTMSTDEESKPDPGYAPEGGFMGSSILDGGTMIYKDAPEEE